MLSSFSRMVSPTCRPGEQRVVFAGIRKVLSVGWRMEGMSAIGPCRAVWANGRARRRNRKGGGSMNATFGRFRTLTLTGAVLAATLAVNLVAQAPAATPL